MDQPLWKNLKFLTFSTSCFHSLRRFFVLENTFFCPTFPKIKRKNGHFSANMQRRRMEQSERQQNLMQTRQNKRFDQESETEKEKLQSFGENISHNINYAELRQLLRDKKKRFKQFR